jgi:hypothetical protein
LLKINNIPNKRKASLLLLNEYALKADFKVFILQTQKLIKKNEVSPINSQPKKRDTKLAELTKKIILIINRFKKTTNRSTLGSYLK